MLTTSGRRPSALGELRAAGVTICGPVRTANEDLFLVDEHLRLCVVADGMGGHAGGAVASRAAVETVTDYVSRGLTQGVPEWPWGFDVSMSTEANLLRTAVHVANHRIVAMAARSSGLAGMGTTVVAALVSAGRLSVAHVGDSRLYLMAADALQLLTADDSMGLRIKVEPRELTA